MGGISRVGRDTQEPTNPDPRIPVCAGECWNKPFLKSVRLCAVPPALGSLSQCPIILREKNLFLIANTNFPWHGFLLFPWVPSLVNREESRTHPSVSPPEESVHGNEVSPHYLLSNLQLLKANGMLIPKEYVVFQNCTLWNFQFLCLPLTDCLC